MMDIAETNITVLGYDVRTYSSDEYRGVDGRYWDWPEGLTDDDARAEIGWNGANGFLWDSLSDVRAWVECKPSESANGVTIIAIGLILESIPAGIELPKVGYAYVHLDVAELREVQKEWTLLGYDVADAFLDSILYPTPDDLSINSDRLSDDIETCLDFARYWNEEDKSHVPFLVYAVYEVEKLHPTVETGGVIA